MNFSSILIVTCSRSGSTLLQGLLNRIPRSLIRGENGNLCWHLYQAYKSLLFGLNKRNMCTEVAGTPQHPWYGSDLMDPELFVSTMRTMVKKLIFAGEFGEDQIDCYGFKEIRYREKDVREDLTGYLDFLAMLFPNPAFVFNVRNPEQIATSGGQRNWPKHLQVENLEDLFAGFRKEHHRLPNSFLISYEDVKAVSPQVKELFDFLGADYNEDTVRDQLSKPHSWATDRSESP